MSNTCKESKKESLETSDKIYYRIKWHPNADPKKAQIVYLDRVKEIRKVISFHDWIPTEKGGDIPWHRVYQIIYGGKTLWDRDTREYNPKLLDASDDFSNTDTLRYNSEKKRWDKVTDKSIERISRMIRVMTLNCLFDIYDKKYTDTAPRLPLIVETIKEVDPDILCVQEITPGMREYFMEHSHIRDNYYVTGNAPKKYGQLTFSKFKPLCVNLVAFGGSHMKKYIQISLMTEDNSKLEVYNIHLTSDHQRYADAKRGKQIEQLIDDISTDKFMIVGDFNSDEDIDVHVDNVVDIWKVLYPDEEGFTFDYTKNKLASVTSQKMLKVRIDRMLSRNVKPLTTRLIGTEPIKGKWLSDHFGLVSEYDTQELFTITKKTSGVEEFKEDAPDISASSLTIRPGTALSVILDLDHWAFINQYRSKHDHSFKSWPPHVTVYQRFTITDDWLKIKDKLHDMMKSNVTVTFDKVEIFPLTQNFALVITSSNPSELVELRNAMGELVDMSLKSTPHITLGTFDNERQAKAVKKDVEREFESYGNIIVNLNTFTLMAKLVDQFQVYDYIGTEPTIDPIQMVRYLANNIKRDDYYIEIVGSRAYGLDDSDYDLIVGGTTDADKFREQLVVYAKMTPHVKYVNLVNSRLPVVNIVMADNTELDVIYTKLISGSICNQMITNMIDVTHKVKSLVGDRMAKFIKLYQIIKKWAKNRQIYGANYGYFNGITWLTLILNLFIKKENMELSKKEFIKEFFRYYDTYDWKIPINISNIKYEGHTPVDHMAILVNICPPSQNIIRGISETTWNIIKDEFARAHRLGDDVDKLFDKRKLTGHVCTITICDPYKFNVLKHKNLIMSNIWKLCIATNGVNPICSWKLSEHNAVYKFGISASTDCGVINSHFKGIDCSISFI